MNCRRKCVRVCFCARVNCWKLPSFGFFGLLEPRDSMQMNEQTNGKTHGQAKQRKQTNEKSTRNDENDGNNVLFANWKNTHSVPSFAFGKIGFFSEVSLIKFEDMKNSQFQHKSVACFPNRIQYFLSTTNFQTVNCRCGWKFLKLNTYSFSYRKELLAQGQD